MQVHWQSNVYSITTNPCKPYKRTIVNSKAAVHTLPEKEARELSKLLLLRYTNTHLFTAINCSFTRCYETLCNTFSSNFVYIRTVATTLEVDVQFICFALDTTMTKMLVAHICAQQTDNGSEKQLPLVTSSRGQGWQTDGCIALNGTHCTSIALRGLLLL